MKLENIGLGPARKIKIRYSITEDDLDGLFEIYNRVVDNDNKNEYPVLKFINGLMHVSNYHNQTQKNKNSILYTELINKVEYLLPTGNDNDNGFDMFIPDFFISFLNIITLIGRHKDGITFYQTYNIPPVTVEIEYEDLGKKRHCITRYIYAEIVIEQPIHGGNMYIAYDLCVQDVKKHPAKIENFGNPFGPKWVVDEVNNYMEENDLKEYTSKRHRIEFNN
ncbi:MAG: hypothetical protein D3903_19855 [Candidatus Electrothrix sp. GM3_4]|nr:hypothetical protein [Candidatus Electrothrix sp. GM3_4]